MLYNGKEIKLLNDADVIVVGGGTAGVVVAYSALKENKSVIILEKSIYLGGTSTNAMVTPFMNSHVAKKDGLNAKLNEMYLDYDKNCWYNFNKKEILFQNCTTYAMFYDKCLKEAGATIYYDATVIDSIVENNKIKYVIAYIHNDLYAISGKVFVDSSAEAILAKSAGCKLLSGNESRNGIHQASSLRYEMGGVDKVKLVNWLKDRGYVGFGIPKNPQDIEFIRDKCYQDIIDKAIENKEVTKDDMRSIQAFRVPGKPNTFAFNGPQLSEKYDFDTPDNMSQSISLLLEAIKRYSNFMINHIPGFEHAFISSIASQVGIRESVRVKTKYIIQDLDYVNRSKFEDGIAKADWYVDIHCDDLKHHEIEAYKPGEYYEIPYRSLITDEVNNMIVAGRIIGCSFKVESSVRIQVTLRDVAEVVGKACAYSIDNNIDINKIDGKVFKHE